MKEGRKPEKVHNNELKGIAINKASNLKQTLDSTVLNMLNNLGSSSRLQLHLLSFVVVFVVVVVVFSWGFFVCLLVLFGLVWGFFCFVFVWLGLIFVALILDNLS